MKAYLKSLAALLLTGCATQNADPSSEAGIPYELSADQGYTVRDYVSSKFHLPRAVHMHEMTASRHNNGIVTVCGMADALGQEGPGEAIGYRAYTGFLAPDRDDFIVTKLASTPTEQRIVFEICRRDGAPIKIPQGAQRIIDAVNS